MKKTLALLLAVVMMVGLLAGCGGTKEESKAPESQAPASTAPEKAPESAAPAEPEAWKPSKAVEIVIPFSAGGSSDLLGRALEPVWSKYCDQPLVITNLPGGGGVTGSVQVATKGPKDEHTLLLGTGSGHDMSMPYLQELEYDTLEMLDLVSLLSIHTVVIATPIDSEFNTMADVIKWSEETGNAITVSVSTANGTCELTAQATKFYTGANMNIVPHDGGGPAVTDLLSGTFTIGMHHPSEVKTYVDGGQLKLLGVAADERDPVFPDLPTLKEQGIDFGAPGSIKGFAMAKGTAPEVIAYYDALIAEIAKDADFQKIMQDLGQPVIYKNTADWCKFFDESKAFYKAAIEDLGLAYYA